MRCYHEGKREFTRTEANTVARRMRDRGAKVHPYRCPSCSVWFVGSSLSGGSQPWGKKRKPLTNGRR